MSYFEKIKYTIQHSSQESFVERVNEVISAVPSVYAVIRLTFFEDVNSNEDYNEKLAIILSSCKKRFKNGMPAVSFVSQPSLIGDLTLEVQSMVLSGDDTLTYEEFKGHSYVSVNNNDYKCLYIGGFSGNNLQENFAVICEDAVNELREFGEMEGFSPADIIRQWNYIERITAINNNEQHYQLFNNARSAYYAMTEWNTGYPAATGIGMNFGGVVIDADIVQFKNQGAKMCAIDNKLQVAAHAYSENVLIADKAQKSTPKFERAKSLDCKDSRFIYISGTAAIRGEASLVDRGIEQQFKMTMENIEELIKGANLSLVRIYLKDSVNLDATHCLMKAYNASLPYSILLADVCRDELMIEIEGVAFE